MALKINNSLSLDKECEMNAVETEAEIMRQHGYEVTPQCRGFSDSGSASQETTRLLQNPNVYHNVQKIPPLDPILSQLNPVHSCTPYFSVMHFNIIIFSFMPKSSLEIFQLNCCMDLSLSPPSDLSHLQTIIHLITLIISDVQVQIIKLLIMHFTHTVCLLISHDSQNKQ